MKSSRSSVRLSSGVASALSCSLMLNFMRPTREKSYLRGSKNMPWNSWRGGVERRRIAGTQLAVDFDQRFVLRLDGILADGRRDHGADFVALREEDFEASMPASISLPIAVVGQLAVGVDQHFAGGHVDHVGGDVGAFEIVRRDFHLLDLRLLDFLDTAMA